MLEIPAINIAKYFKPLRFIIRYLSNGQNISGTDTKQNDIAFFSLVKTTDAVLNVSVACIYVHGESPQRARSNDHHIVSQANLAVVALCIACPNLPHSFALDFHADILAQVAGICPRFCNSRTLNVSMTKSCKSNRWSFDSLPLRIRSLRMTCVCG